MIRWLITTLIAAMPTLLLSQNLSDALRYSQNFSAGTARFTSMGGAFGALGADFTSLSYNPAGLGVYRTSEFTVTPSFTNRAVKSSFAEQTLTDSRSRFNLDNLGFVASFGTLAPEDKGLVNVNLGFGYNRLNHFYGRELAGGENPNNSILDAFATKANGLDSYDITSDTTWNPYNEFSPNDWDAILAWNTILIDTTSFVGEYRPSLNDGDGVNQEHSRSTLGGIGEYVISLGANFSHKLYLGASVGIQDVFFSQTTIHNERAFGSNEVLHYIDDRFNSMEYTQVLNVQGIGANLKVGGIYRPIPQLRIGAALHTPTYFRIEESYRASMTSNLNSGNYGGSTPTASYNYRIESPFRAIGSLAYTFGNIGLISVDYEYVNFSSARLRDGADGYQFYVENDSIKSDLRSAFNLRGGAEVWLGDVALRGGYAWYGSPYSAAYNLTNSGMSIISGGIGFRTGNMFLDAAYQHMLYNDSYRFYNLVDENNEPLISPVKRNTSQGKALLTIGFKF